MQEILQILNKYWGYSGFRSVQEQIVESVLAKRDTLGLMPTGGGKSLTFQAPAMHFPGMCLVISPLIALMNDQVEKLKKLGISATALHSGLTYRELMLNLDNAVYGAYKILYVSPERLITDVFMAKICNANISFITIDEAHCISQWGYDFRPSYLQIAKLRELLPNVPILALTATATPEVVEDIQDKLQFRSRNTIQSDFARPNLVYYVRYSESKMTDLLNVVKSQSGTGIVYLRSRKKTREIAEYLTQSGVKADFYHAGLSYENRLYRQKQWFDGHSRVMVSTNAFGMGIDKPNVRFVIHMDLPDSPEAYFQEAGRGGRDGKKAFAVLLVNNYDKTVFAQRLAVSFPEIKEIKRVYSALANFLQVPVGSGKGVGYDFNLFDFSNNFKINSVLAFNALKILENIGYIELTDEINNPSRILFLLNRDDLYKFQIENVHFDGFIKLVLRSYTGIFSEFTVIDEEILSKRANISRDLVYKYLVKLAQMKVITYIPAKKTPMVVFTEERLDETLLYISHDEYNEKKNRYEKRMKAMLNYAFGTDICRSKILLEYFGQSKGEDCGNCDVCKSKNKGETTENEVDIVMAEIMSKLHTSHFSLKEINQSIGAANGLFTLAIQNLLDNDKIAYRKDGNLEKAKK